jgi:hypothetical protein
MKTVELEKVTVDMAPSMKMNGNLQIGHLFDKNEMLF